MDCRSERQARQAVAAVYNTSGGQQRYVAVVETRRTDGSICGQGVAGKYRGPGKSGEVGMEGHRPSRQVREEVGGKYVDIDPIDAGEGDVNCGGCAKIHGIIQGDLVAARLVMEEGHCRRGGGIRESSKRRIGHARQLEVEVGRGCVVGECERPRRADGNCRIAAAIFRNRPGRRQRKETGPRGRRRKSQKGAQEESGTGGTDGYRHVGHQILVGGERTIRHRCDSLQTFLPHHIESPGHHKLTGRTRAGLSQLTAFRGGKAEAQRTSFRKRFVAWDLKN